MAPFDLLGYLSSVLNDLGVRYLVTGSTATILYGEPRLTNDIDVVVELSSKEISALCARFPPGDYYVSREAVAEAVVEKGQFDIIHPASGLKIDVMIAGNTPFDRSRLQRARRESPTPGASVCFASPEDVIIKKLEFYKLGGSEKHLRDITGVLKIQGPTLDRAYISRWADQLGLRDVWESIVLRLDAKP